MIRRTQFDSLLRLAGPGLDIRLDADLTPQTSMRMHTRAAVHAHATSPNGLMRLMRESRRLDSPAFLLGGGCNTLFATSRFDGIVFSLGGDFNRLEYAGGNIVRAGAGVKLGRIVTFARECGLMGLEFLTMVPGTVGGALAGNAGAGNWGLCDFVENVILTTRDGFLANVRRNQFRYGYRYSDLREAILLEAEFRLEPLDETERRRRVEEYRAKKTNQPFNEPSSGCIFKNPKDPETGQTISAGKLIDECGLKGYTIRSARISERHANFIVNNGDSCGEDFLALINLVRDIVHQKTGIELELEVQIVGGPMSSAILT